MSGNFFVRAALLFGLLATVSQAAIVVQFDRSLYEVTPGGTFSAQVHLDGDDAVPGVQPLPFGLMSFGVKLTYGANATVAALSDIAVPAELDTDGFEVPAIREIGDGYAAAKGAIAFFADPYGDSLLMNVQLTNLATSDYTLGLSLFSQFESDQLFYDGAGNNFDGDILFGQAMVTVVPEPVMSGFLAIVGILGMQRWARCTFSQ